MHEATCKLVFYTPNDYEQSIHTELTLVIHVEGKQQIVFVSNFFKGRWGKLSKKRQTAIICSMPDKVQVKKWNSKRRGDYYSVTRNDLEAWLRQAQREHAHC